MSIFKDLQYLIQQKIMDIEKVLEEPTTTQPLIEGHFIFNNLLTRLVLFHNSIYFSNSKLACTYQINFDFSYDIVLEGYGWLLIINTPEQFRFFSYVELDGWEKVLIKIMKRRKFHSLYRGIKKIGKGNFASVYLSQRIADGKLFAVKAFNKQNVNKSKNGKEALQNQIYILRKFQHPNIIHLESVFQTQNSIYLVMDLIRGKNLGQILDEKKILPLPIRKKILQGILAGLGQMQAKNIAHRDIKPENIMVDLNGQAKIVDFGLATNTQAPKYLYVRCGTPGFVAPEIITIKDTEQARMTTISDVFSAGAILYHMIFGKALFEGKKNAQILQKNRRCLYTIPTCSQFASFQQLVLLRRMLDIFPHTRITASQALRLNFFNSQRQPLKQINSIQPVKQDKQIRFLAPLKYAITLPERPRMLNRVQQIYSNKQN